MVHVIFFLLVFEELLIAGLCIAGGVVVSGVAMSGGGGGVSRLSPPLTPMEGLSVPAATGGGGTSFTQASSNGPPSPG